MQNKQFKVGEKINGEFNVVEVFGGEGKTGMGVVYLVDIRDYPEPVVLKTCQKTDKESKAEFIKEAKSWINIGVHQNIVKAIWVREFSDGLFVCAEFIHPDENNINNLAQIIQRGKVRNEFVLGWAAQFCYGMEFACSKGMIAHRDIKPANLMIDPNGVLKITDFGIAKSKVNNEKSGLFYFLKNKPINSETQWGDIKGTLPYMAPEQFVNTSKVDQRADIYSFGVVLFQLTTGNFYPYEIDNSHNDTMLAYKNAHINQEPRLPDSPLTPLIKKCLEKRKEDRYQSFNELLGDIKIIASKLSIKLPTYQVSNAEDEELYAKAQSYSALGEPIKAYRNISEYVQRFPENYCGWTEKGRIEHEQGLFEQSEISTRKSLEIYPYNSHAWNNLGLLLKRINPNLKLSIDAFDKGNRF